jgi:hypothetical protein
MNISARYPRGVLTSAERESSGVLLDASPTHHAPFLSLPPALR